MVKKIKKSGKLAKAKKKPVKKLLKKIESASLPILDCKAIAISFLNLVTTGKIREAYDRHASSKFRHHNPFSPGDRESIILAMEENEKKFPNKIFEVKRAIAEGELVAVHSRVKLNPDDLELATAHFFRFENYKIAEFWDVGQVIPKDSPNGNTMF